MLLRIRETPIPMNQYIPRQDVESSSTRGSTTRTSVQSSTTPTSRTYTSSPPTSSSQASTSSPATPTSSSASQSSSASFSSASSTPTLTSESSGSGSSNSVLIGSIVGGVIGGLLLLSIVSILFSAWRRRRNDARKRPRMSIVAGDMPSRGKRPATLYTLDSFLMPTVTANAQMKPSHQHHASEASAVAVPLLGTSSTGTSTTTERIRGVDEHGAVIEHYSDDVRPPSRGSVTQRTEESHLVSPYSVDDHSAGSSNDETAPRIPSSNQAIFAPLIVPAAGFRLDLLPHQESATSAPRRPTPPILSFIPPPPKDQSP
ncbi:hypothetical protein WG66_000555 [Moniliophthora roreri]|uniref:Uncharacterized protein n=1 Tax=Moniliophthora roreri TaxID=221103 RepID=A0A0W0F1A7_MONRR|nr:hypothetical protein WG66_000555 [Moniliophthora roreri]